MLKRIAILFITLSINGCGDEYRYHCQDPKHFGDAQCQKPACEFSQTCPDYLAKGLPVSSRRPVLTIL